MAAASGIPLFHTIGIVGGSPQRTQIMADGSTVGLTTTNTPAIPAPANIYAITAGTGRDRAKAIDSSEPAAYLQDGPANANAGMVFNVGGVIYGKANVGEGQY